MYKLNLIYNSPVSQEQEPITLIRLAKEASGITAYEWAQEGRPSSILNKIRGVYWGANEVLLPSLTRLRRELGQEPTGSARFGATVHDVFSILVPSALMIGTEVVARNFELSSLAFFSGKFFINGLIHWELDSLSKEQSLTDLQPSRSYSEEEDEEPARPPLIGEPPPGSIEAQYAGMLSENLFWNHDLLDELVEISDLRSHVTIKNGLERNEGSVVNLGEIMAWRKFVNPMELLQSTIQEKEESAIKSSYMTGEVEVVINDEVIADKIKKENEGRLEKKAFATRLDGVVRENLADAIRWEKKTQLLLGPATVATMLASVGVCGYTIYRIIDSVAGAAGDLMSGRAHLEDPSWLLTPTLTIVASNFVVSLIGYTLRRSRQLGNSSFPGYRYIRDLNPFKHFRAMSEGVSLLEKAKGNVVHLKEE